MSSHAESTLQKEDPLLQNEIRSLKNVSMGLQRAPSPPIHSRRRILECLPPSDMFPGSFFRGRRIIFLRNTPDCSTQFGKTVAVTVRLLPARCPFLEFIFVARFTSVRNESGPLQKWNERWFEKGRGRGVWRVSISLSLSLSLPFSSLSLSHSSKRCIRREPPSIFVHPRIKVCGRRSVRRYGNGRGGID